MLRAIVFDWGDTVMRNLPYAGPMVDWPRVEAVPGVAEALAALAPRYRLVLATNAADSGRAQVVAALRRADLGDSFHAVYTARELGARKPEPAFFAAIVGELGCAPGEAAMVGDDYAADIAGAKAAGLRGIWLNPGGAPAPTADPLHDAEVRAMAELPAALAALHLPDVAGCLSLLAGQEAPPQVVCHCQAVAAIAYRLAVELRSRGEAVDPLLAHRGGLLHDLAKITSSRQGETHGALGARLLRELGQERLAAIVERHLMFSIAQQATKPATWEEKLVYYVDKVVEGERVVSVPTRIGALCRRYPQNARRIRSCLPQVLALEAEIRGRLEVRPGDWLGMLRAWEYRPEA